MGSGSSSSRHPPYVLRVVEDTTVSAVIVTSPDSNKIVPDQSPAGKLMKQQSSKSNMNAPPKRSMSMSNKIRPSAKVPWLLKEGSFPNADLNSFEIGTVIGRGLMGNVRIAKSKQYNCYVALKSIRKDYVEKHNDYRHVNNERILLQQLSQNSNPFCIRLFGTFQDSQYLHFVLEFAAGGELFRRLTKKAAFPAPVAKFYASEVFCARRHIHSLGYVYRDLKPENLLDRLD